MFNKPNLFPKATEPQAVRSGRTFSGGQPTGPSSAQSDSVGTLREPSAPSGSGVFSSAVSNVASAQKADNGSKEVDRSEVSESRLIVGPDVKLKGAEILDCDTLVVEGRVEATMDSRVLRVAENGSFAGTVGIDVAEINGQFDGELTARSQLIIHATGRVSGKIRYGKIFIEEGGQISGDIRALDSTPQKARETQASDPVSSISSIKTADTVA